VPLAATNRSLTEVTFREVIAGYGLLNRFMGSHFSRFGITGAKWAVLRTLHRAQQQEGLHELRPGDLVERLLVRPPSVTAVVGRLSRQGLVSVRRPEGQGADHRERRIALTPEGFALVETVLQAHSRRVAAAMSGLSDADQERLYVLLARLNEHLRAMVTAEPKASPARPAGRDRNRSDPE
jgi:DNA-binding MarR family transcriptional regulator